MDGYGAKVGGTPAAVKINAVALMIAIAALLVPFVTNDAGAHGLREAGDATGRLLAGAVAFGAIATALTWRRSPVAKAAARVVVALLLCAVAAVSYVEASKNEAARRVIREAIRSNERDREAFAEIRMKLDVIDLSHVLEPAGMVTPAGLAGSRKRIDSFDKVLAERRAQVATMLGQMRAQVALIPPGPVHDAAYNLRVRWHADFQRLFKAVDDAEVEQSAGVHAVLDWAQAQAGKFSASGNQLMLSSAAQQAQLGHLVDALKLADAHSKAAHAAFQAFDDHEHATEAADIARLKQELDF